MKLEATPIPGLTFATTTAHLDARGSFRRLFCADELRPALGKRSIAQINLSSTARTATVRGLHFQHAPHAEMKLVRCLRGRIWDVAVDLRAGSPTLLRWFALELCPADGRMLIVPEGFAHGFQTLEPDSEILYLHTAPHAPGSEGGVAWDDARIAVAWPLPVDREAGLSERDRRLPALAPSFQGIPA